MLFSVLVGAEAVTPRLLLGFVIIFIAIVVSETKLEFLQKRKRRQNVVPVTAKLKTMTIRNL